ncbi:uncharacterized protein TNCV_413711 [Trichonephila clavipes]|nr:uncharacterized protein TNCV_413711 [Trichonephila clavipes]
MRETSPAVLMAEATIPVTTIKEENGMDDLRVVYVKVKGEQEMVNAVMDTGAQMPVVRPDVVEGQSIDNRGSIQITSAFGEHETSMKKQKCLPEERCKRMNEQNQLLNEEEEKFSDEDMEVTQAIEKVLVSKGEQIQTRSTDQYAVAQSVVEKEKEEISVDVIKDKDENNPGKLAWKLTDFIKRDGTVKIRQSSRENRSTRRKEFDLN